MGLFLVRKTVRDAVRWDEIKGCSTGRTQHCVSSVTVLQDMNTDPPESRSAPSLAGRCCRRTVEASFHLASPLAAI